MQISSNPPLSFPENFNSSSVFGFPEEIEDDFSLKLDLNQDLVEEKQPVPEEDDGEDEEEGEFSFVCMNPDGSPISADDIFQDGQIRPFYPLFDRDLRRQLEKVLVEERDGDCGSSVSSSEAEDPQGLYCPWTKKAEEDSGEAACRKSNSTGFSKLRRFREMILRSTSDGKDAFVFLHHHDHRSGDKPEASVIAVAKRPAEKSEKAAEGKKIDNRPPPAPKSAHERLYVQNRAAKVEHKRKSYLPYRVGFFTRNVHPY